MHDAYNFPTLRMQPRKDLFIIIAEDDPDDVELLRTAFENHPAYKTVMCYSNGVELIAAIDQDTRPDVILTDINMPVMGGLEALAGLQLHNIPTVVFSTIANPTLESKYLELGVIGFLKKPLNFKGYSELPKKVNDILEKI